MAGRDGLDKPDGAPHNRVRLMTHELVQLARAADYAARQHIAQRRKGEAAEPYINHLTEVAALLAEATGGEDVVLLMGGLLHDTLEDTDATYEDLVQRFGPEVAALVAEVTDDKSLPQGGAQAPAGREDAGQIAARQTAQDRRQDLQPARPGAKPAERMDSRSACATMSCGPRRSCARAAGSIAELEAAFDAAHAEASRHFA